MEPKQVDEYFRSALQNQDALPVVLSHSPADLHEAIEVIQRARVLAAAMAEEISKPIPMLLFCPRCQTPHVDRPDPIPNRPLTPEGKHRLWTNPPHATHTCEHCKLLWRPSNRNTVGVAMIEVREPAHVARIRAAYPWIVPEEATPAMLEAVASIIEPHAAAMLWARMLEVARKGG